MCIYNCKIILNMFLLVWWVAAHITGDLAAPIFVSFFQHELEQLFTCVPLKPKASWIVITGLFPAFPLDVQGVS